MTFWVYGCSGCPILGPDTGRGDSELPPRVCHAAQVRKSLVSKTVSFLQFNIFQKGCLTTSLCVDYQQLHFLMSRNELICKNLVLFTEYPVLLLWSRKKISVKRKKELETCSIIISVLGVPGTFSPWTFLVSLYLLTSHVLERPGFPSYTSGLRDSVVMPHWPLLRRVTVLWPCRVHRVPTSTVTCRSHPLAQRSEKVAAGHCPY